MPSYWLNQKIILQLEVVPIINFSYD